MAVHGALVDHRAEPVLPEQRVADEISGWSPDLFFYLGDVYANGSREEFANWYGEDGAKLRTCTILTTAANSAIASLHDRMPVILAPGAETAWLDVETPHELLPEILSGLPPEQTAMAPVGPAVNDARYDGPECLAAPAPSAQVALF